MNVPHQAIEKLSIRDMRSPGMKRQSEVSENAATDVGEPQSMLNADSIRMIADQLNLRDRINLATVNRHYNAVVSEVPSRLKPQGKLPFLSLTEKNVTNEHILEQAIRGKNLIELADDKSQKEILAALISHSSFEERSEAISALCPSFSTFAHDNKLIFIKALLSLPEPVGNIHSSRESYSDRRNQFNRALAAYKLFLTNPGIGDEYARQVIPQIGRIGTILQDKGKLDLSDCKPSTQLEFLNWASLQRTWRSSLYMSFARASHTLCNDTFDELFKKTFEIGQSQDADLLRPVMMAIAAKYKPEKFETIASHLLGKGHEPNNNDLIALSLLAKSVPERFHVRLESAVMRMPANSDGYNALLALASNQPVRLPRAFTKATDFLTDIAGHVNYDSFSEASPEFKSQISGSERNAIKYFQDKWITQSLFSPERETLRKLFLRNFDELKPRNKVAFLTEALGAQDYATLDVRLRDIIPVIQHVPSALHDIINKKLQWCISRRHSANPIEFSEACLAAIEVMHQLPLQIQRTVSASLRGGGYFRINDQFGVPHESIAESITSSNQSRLQKIILTIDNSQERDIALINVAAALQKFSPKNLRYWIRGLKTLSEQNTKNAARIIQERVDCFAPSAYRHILHELDVALEGHASVIALPPSNVDINSA